MFALKTNTQPIERVNHDPDGMLEVHSIFPTIQGEGPFVGMPAVFVRLAGCVLNCRGCDTDYTSKRERMSPDDLHHRVVSYLEWNEIRLANFPLLVITGGEPFRQNITPFVGKALECFDLVQVETNGALYLSDLPYQRDDFHVVCSPKTEIHPELAKHVHDYKYVGRAGDLDEDGLPIHALGLSSRVARPPGRYLNDGTMVNIYLQPEDQGEPLLNKANLDACIQSCMKFGYTLSYQLHKAIGME